MCAETQQEARNSPSASATTTSKAVKTASSATHGRANKSAPGAGQSTRATFVSVPVPRPTTARPGMAMSPLATNSKLWRANAWRTGTAIKCVPSGSAKVRKGGRCPKVPFKYFFCQLRSQAHDLCGVSAVTAWGNVAVSMYCPPPHVYPRPCIPPVYVVGFPSPDRDLRERSLFPAR